MHHRRCREVLPLWASLTHRGLAGPPQTWCCEGSDTSSSQLRERNAVHGQEPKLSNLHLLLPCLSSSQQVTPTFPEQIRLINDQKIISLRNKPSTLPLSLLSQWSNTVPPRCRVPCLLVPSHPTPPLGTPPPTETTALSSMYNTLQSPSIAPERNMGSHCERSEST